MGPPPNMNLIGSCSGGDAEVRCIIACRSGKGTSEPNHTSIIIWLSLRIRSSLKRALQGAAHPGFRTPDVTHGGLRSCDHWRRLERRQRGARRRGTRLIHGDLAVLERRAFFRVRAALAERDIWLRTAPHLVRPMRFVIPAHSDERPSWLLRSGLLLYDRLAPRGDLPASATVDVTHHPVGNALKRPFGTAFEYSDCVVDDSRLVVLNAVDAAE